MSEDQILEDQVQELRSRPNELRLNHIKMLEECNSDDIIPLSKAINHLHDNPPLHFNLNQTGVPDEEKRLYEEMIPFEEWCFVVLLLRKPAKRIYCYDDGADEPLLQKHQGPDDALIENGIVCGQCFMILSSPKRCSKCKTVCYCSKDCQASHWKKHKKQCRPGRLKREKYNTREGCCQENESMTDYIANHPYPKFGDIMASLFGHALPAFYTEDIHSLFETVYNYVGKNTFKVYGRELGQTLFDQGGMDVLYQAKGIISSVVMKAPLHYSERDKEIGQQKMVEVFARRLLDRSWDGIGTWSSYDSTLLSSLLSGLVR
jgi:hypothetical protein